MFYLACVFIHIHTYVYKTNIILFFLFCFRLATRLGTFSNKSITTLSDRSTIWIVFISWTSGKKTNPTTRLLICLCSSSWTTHRSASFIRMFRSSRLRMGNASKCIRWNGWSPRFFYSRLGGYSFLLCIDQSYRRNDTTRYTWRLSIFSKNLGSTCSTNC